MIKGSGRSSVSIVTKSMGWKTGIRFLVGVRRLYGPASFLSSGYQGLFPPEVKRPGSESDLPPPSSVEVKNA